MYWSKCLDQEIRIASVCLQFCFWRFSPSENSILAYGWLFGPQWQLGQLSNLPYFARPLVHVIESSSIKCFIRPEQRAEAYGRKCKRIVEQILEHPQKVGQTSTKSIKMPNIEKNRQSFIDLRKKKKGRDHSGFGIIENGQFGVESCFYDQYEPWLAMVNHG